MILKTAVELASMRGCPAKQHAASFALSPPGRKAAGTATSVIPAKERVKKSKLQTSARLRSVIPAKAGTHFSRWNKTLAWVPAFAGTTLRLISMRISTCKLALTAVSGLTAAEVVNRTSSDCRPGR